MYYTDEEVVLARSNTRAESLQLNRLDSESRRRAIRAGVQDTIERLRKLGDDSEAPEALMDAIRIQGVARGQGGVFLMRALFRAEAGSVESIIVALEDERDQLEAIEPAA